MPKLLEAVHYRFHGNTQKPGIERIQEEEEDICDGEIKLYIFRVRGYIVTATKPVHRLQIHPIVHN